jgi:hypothetical protein
MAMSNCDRVGKLFELMAPALDRFIGAAVAPALTSDDASWTGLVALKDQQKGIQGRTYSATDPQVQLRMLTENVPHHLKPGWYPFDDAIGRVGQGFAKELRAYRNDRAHNAPFTDDDAYRCLDTGAAPESDRCSRCCRRGQGDPIVAATADGGQGRQEGHAGRRRGSRKQWRAAVAQRAAATLRRRDRELPGGRVCRRPIQGVGFQRACCLRPSRVSANWGRRRRRLTPTLTRAQ